MPFFPPHAPGSGNGGLAELDPVMVLGRSGGKIVKFGDSLIAGNGGAQYSILLKVQDLLKSRFSTAGLGQPTYADVSAGGNTTHDIWVTGRAGIISNLGSDAQDLLGDGAINDIIRPAGNDGFGPISQAQSIQFIRSGFDGVFATYPNTRIWYVGPIWGDGEKWIVDAQGNVVGNNTYDGRIQALDRAIAKLCAQYDNVKYVSIYDAVYRTAPRANPTNATSLKLTQDGIHPALPGVDAIGDEVARQAVTAGFGLPNTVMPTGRFDLGEGDWFVEQRRFVEAHLSSGAGSTLNTGTFNREVRVDANSLFLPISTAPTGVTDSALNAGALNLQNTAVLLLSRLGITTPKTTVFAVVLRVKFGAIGASMVAQIGLVNAAGNSSFTFGLDQPTNGTKFVYWQQLAAAFTKTASTTNVSTTEGNLVFLHQPSENGVNIIDVLFTDSTGLVVQAVHDNPGANFPTGTLALGNLAIASSGQVDFKRALLMFNE